MKPQQIISILSAVTLLFLIIYQSFGLWQRFATEKALLQEEIAECLQLADYTDLSIRMQEIKQLEKIEHGTMTVDAGMTSSKMKGSVSVRYSADSLADTLQTMVRGMKRPEEYHAMAQLTFRGIHSGLDALYDISMERVDSLLAVSLAEHRIGLPYHLYRLKLNEELPETIDSASFIPIPLFQKTLWSQDHKHKHLPPAQSGFTRQIASIWISSEGSDFLYPYEMSRRMAYYLQVTDMNRLVWMRMSGLMAFSLFTILLTAFALFYFLRILRRMQQIKEMEQNFVHNITHELKTPLAVAMAAQEVLADNRTENETANPDHLSIIGQKLQELDELINRILSLGRIRHLPDPNAVLRLSRALQSVWDDCRVRMVPHDSLTVDVPDDISVRMQADDLCAVVQVLMDNAIKYSAPPVQIEVCAVAHAHNLVTLSVTDHGRGIPPEAIPYIFDRFYRVPEGDVQSVRGYGLGLSYAYDLMRAYGGRITVKSMPGQGSTFTLYFRN